MAIDTTTPEGREPSCVEERGRGVLMMRTLMDQCENSRTEQGVKVRMVKQKAHADST